MYCTKKITDDLFWVGANDRRLAMFEGVYSVPNGVSYNSYLLLDEKTVLFDAVDKACQRQFMENLEHALSERTLDYVVIHHMEPDHSATLDCVLQKYPNAKIVCNEKIKALLHRFFDLPFDNLVIVKEGDELSFGRHEITFINAPMVHWPEVMMSYDKTDKILFTADAFGSFGALNGAIFADEVDFFKDYMNEARRYYSNIVGKYGVMVENVLKKVDALEIKLVCPLHGFVWRKDFDKYLEKYRLWAAYKPEKEGVMIAYASVYGNTENATEILSCRLRDKGVETEIFDVSVTPSSEIISAAFRWSHLVFASTTYNAGVFVRMEELLRDLAAHNIQNRTVAFIENGSWAPASGKLMREILQNNKGLKFVDKLVTVRSSVKEENREELAALADAIAKDFSLEPQKIVPTGNLEPSAFFKLSYGLFVLTTKLGEKDNGCIINTCQLVTDNPKRVTIAVNKKGYTAELIKKSRIFNVSVLSESCPFSTFRDFGMRSGRDCDKFDGGQTFKRSTNGLKYLIDGANAFISAVVEEIVDVGTHLLIIGKVTETENISGEPSATYDYYFKHIKSSTPSAKPAKKGFVCKICGYVYEGETLPDDFVCPLCKHGASDFEPLT